MSSSTISTQDARKVSSLALLSGEKLERRLAELLHQDRFAPPPQFVASERINEASLHARAELDPDAFWAEQARQLHWDKPFTTVLDDSNPPFYKWFTDGKLNVSYNCLDRHVEAGLGNRVAFHWAGEEGEQRAITYAELHRDVQRLANALKELGVAKGDIVGIYLPMIPEVVVAMLACARIGAPHNVVFGGFAPGGGQGADGGLRRQGADHGRRRAAQGQDRAGEGRRRRRDGRPRVARAHHRRAPHPHRHADGQAPRRVLRRDPRRG